MTGFVDHFGTRAGASWVILAARGFWIVSKRFGAVCVPLALVGHSKPSVFLQNTRNPPKSGVWPYVNYIGNPLILYVFHNSNWP